MPFILSRQPGIVSVIPGPANVAQLMLRIDRAAPYALFRSIVIGLGISSACKFSLRHMFGGDAFIYTFGDSVGRVMLTGLAFANYCDDNNNVLGIERVAAYYNANRLSFREDPIYLTVGSSLSFKLYLAGIETKVEDPSQQIWRFDMMFLAVPPVLPRLTDKKAGAAGNAGGAAGGAVAGSGTSNETLEGTIASTSFATGGLGLGTESLRNYDSGGWASDSTVIPVTADGYDAYKTGPTTPKVSSFSLAD